MCAIGTNLIKYIVTALVVMNYGAFLQHQPGFVNAGNWISNASGECSENWGLLKNQLIRMVFRTFGNGYRRTCRAIDGI